MDEKIGAAIMVVWLTVLLVAFLPILLLIAVINDDAARHFFVGMVAGAAVYLAFFA